MDQQKKTKVGYHSTVYWFLSISFLYTSVIAIAVATTVHVRYATKPVSCEEINQTG